MAKMKLKYKLIIAFIVLAITVIYIITGQNYEQERWERHYNQFDSCEINGEIDYIGIKAHGVNFKIKGIKEDFIFYPYTSETNNYKSFSRIAEKGDSVIKIKFADTLKLIKDGTEYLYTFEQLKLSFD